MAFSTSNAGLRVDQTPPGADTDNPPHPGITARHFGTGDRRFLVKLNGCALSTLQLRCRRRPSESPFISLATIPPRAAGSGRPRHAQNSATGLDSRSAVRGWTGLRLRRKECVRNAQPGSRTGTPGGRCRRTGARAGPRPGQYTGVATADPPVRAWHTRPTKVWQMRRGSDRLSGKSVAPPARRAGQVAFPTTPAGQCRPPSLPGFRKPGPRRGRVGEISRAGVRRHCIPLPRSRLCTNNPCSGTIPFKDAARARMRAHSPPEAGWPARRRP